MKLKTHTKKIIRLSDWDQLVIDTYGKPYSFQQQDDCKPRGLTSIVVPAEDPYDFEGRTEIPEIVNGREMGVTFEAWKARDPKQKFDVDRNQDTQWCINLWWERNFYPHVDMIANDLHIKGLLDAGEYSIEIDW